MSPILPSSLILSDIFLKGSLMRKCCFSVRPAEDIFNKLDSKLKEESLTWSEPHCWITRLAYWSSISTKLNMSLQAENTSILSVSDKVQASFTELEEFIEENSECKYC